MKKILFTALLSVIIIHAKAQQITVEEPEFAEQSLVLTSDAAGKLLPRENAVLKTKAAASLYLTGIGKIKTRITLNGKNSTTIVKKEPTIKLIVKAVDNKTDPKSFINLFKFEVKQNKRQALVSELGTFSGASENSLSSIDYNAKKYGESSYLISLDNLTPGEYGMIMGDPNALTKKNTLMVTTFRVADLNE